MNFDIIEKQIKQKQQDRFDALKADISIDTTVEENIEKKYKIRKIPISTSLFYHDIKKDRALITRVELQHLMDKETFTNCLPKRWDTGQKTSDKQRKKIVKRIESYYIKLYNKVIFR
ncbi:hypothetical protein J2Q11_13025 [Tenacibaculum finnmarkense genomovar finnmarkense]|uniref:hypothetical protein n=1 Tax=Tenacibaculum finnmarkense TaxID=2781243 RepID=UPI001E378A27|nr:hypothetical protein [Tenacibaculum finnmarkense]MCD8418567.1 hypothetical protein [Tenacibaculum finnmarkense genomovar finnmarkense]MCG8186925.1 hypothetical protein [Tenacibaculum finnmarkense genomovar finnmarkense]MCG8203475.1 hypothetical protein [Tenacibaculum finnmarkense genomovar finnmarkense]MCG8210947.1 hypothetical protein [Tenacibaculum finnmarkense genomovar finnmarkense]MCG8221060.1 hypothetical protein [Tenacibaculum finnmarkense genomovar finnmarkense]